MDIQPAISLIVDKLPEEGFTLVDSYRAKGAAIMVCHDEMTRIGWLNGTHPPDWGGLQAQVSGPERSSNL